MCIKQLPCQDSDLIINIFIVNNLQFFLESPKKIKTHVRQIKVSQYDTLRHSTPETIQKIVQSLDLQPVEEAESELSVPDVEWGKKEGDTVYKVYSAEYENLWRYLWVDETNGTVFYQEYST